jgi:hypothetical protein
VNPIVLQAAPNSSNVWSDMWWSGDGALIEALSQRRRRLEMPASSWRQATLGPQLNITSLRPAVTQVKHNKHSREDSIALFSDKGTIDSGPVMSQIQPPDLDALNLSDSDSDALFDTPAAKKNTKKARSASRDAAESGAGGKARAKESHYTAEEAREQQLRQELESVRNVNKVIESVVESLQKARDNMDVCKLLNMIYSMLI